MKTNLLPRRRKGLPLVLALIATVSAPAFAGEGGRSPVPGHAGEVYPITLETALRLADERNTEIAIQLEEQKQSVLDEKAAYL